MFNDYSFLISEISFHEQLYFESSDQFVLFTCKMYISNTFLIISFFVASTCSKILEIYYTKNYKDEYTCIIEGQEFSEEEELFFNNREKGPFFTEDEEVLEIVFNEMNMTYVPNLIFKIYPNVKTLFLDQTNLKSWKRNYLEGARRLKTLRIWSSSIAQFDGEAFAEVPQLNSLSIWMSDMRTINAAMFKHFTNLIELDLRHNIFVNLPGNAFHLIASTVAYINLSRTNLEKIPSGMFVNFERLVELDLSENNLLPINASTTLPYGLQKLHVCELMLENNDKI